MIYDTPELYLAPASKTKALELECINYLHQEPIEYKNLSQHDKYRVELAKFMLEQVQADRTLFHMTITYLQYENRIYSEKDVNTFFKHFYVRKFIPYLMNTRNYTTNIAKSLQPVTLAFIDEHEQLASPTFKYNHNNNVFEQAFEFPTRLHHHVILAVHNDSLQKMLRLVGQNTLKYSIFSSKIMSSDIKQCEPLRLMYASKKFHNYPDFMIFPDKLHRERVKYSNY